jgi:hypothetical protein
MISLLFLFIHAPTVIIGLTCPPVISPVSAMAKKREVATIKSYPTCTDAHPAPYARKKVPMN